MTDELREMEQIRDPEALREERMAGFEAILFAMGNSVPAEVLRESLGLTEEELEETAGALRDKYARADSGIELVKLEDAWQLRTKRAFFDVLRKTAQSPVRPSMTGTLLEVLSIVAYRQPVTRQEIADIRGISSDYAVNRLVEFGLIEECGRQDAPGRAILFGTTEEFLRQFGLQSVRELPAVSIPEDEEAVETESAAAEQPEEAQDGEAVFEETEVPVEEEEDGK